MSNHLENQKRLLDDASPLPLYHRLYLLLREGIFNGAYPPGRTLPAEAELMRIYGVSRITVQRALNTLASDGLLTRARGRGSIVNEDIDTSRLGKPVAVDISGLLASLSIVGQGTTVKVISVEYQAAPAYVAQQLRIEPGTIIQHAERVRMLSSKPYAHSVSYIPQEIGQTFTTADLEKHALIDLLRRTRIRIGKVEQAITCTLADERTAGLLETQIGSPILKLRRVFISTKDRPINYAEIFYSPERFEYRMTWNRNEDDQMQLEDSVASMSRL